MTHPRQAIRHAVADLLTNQTDAGARVYSTRIPPLKKPELPAISVYTADEEVDLAWSLGSGPRELRRLVNVAIEGAVIGDNVDDAMDALASQIEKAMSANRWLGFTDDTVVQLYDIILISTELDTGEQGQREVGVVRLTYRVEYYSDDPALADQAALPDFTKATETYNLANVQPTGDQAQDSETIPII